MTRGFAFVVAVMSLYNRLANVILKRIIVFCFISKYVTVEDKVERCHKTTFGSNSLLVQITSLVTWGVQGKKDEGLNHKLIDQMITSLCCSHTKSKKVSNFTCVWWVPRDETTQKSHLPEPGLLYTQTVH